jgi:hypothetical protein
MDINGREIAVLIRSKVLQPGRYIEYFDISKYHPAPGLYYFSLDDGQKSLRQKMIIR